MNTLIDPHSNFRFRVQWDGRYVAGFSKVSALDSNDQVIPARDGDDSARKSPQRTQFDAITLERGVTNDAEFASWLANSHGTGGMDFRKDITLEAFDEAGELAIRYIIHRSWVSEFHGLPDLDASAKAVAIQHISLENEGWERYHDPP